MISYMMEWGLPAVGTALETADPQETMVGFTGKTRAATLRGYAKSWGRFREWLMMARGRCFPSGVLDLIDYLHVLLGEPAKPSVPGTFLQAVAWMEKAGGKAVDRTFAADPLVRRTAD